MKKAMFLQAGIGFVFLCCFPFDSTHFFTTASKKSRLTKQKVAEVVGSAASFYQFPSQLELQLDGQGKVGANVQYSFNQKLQKSMEELFKAYTPDYGAFIALEPTTGKILSMVSYSKVRRAPDNLTLRASFPSASVFKVVTAAAAIEDHKISGNTVIPFNGRNHTLYRGQILKSNITRWTRFVTLREAFARSVNTVFGRIGAYTVGQDGMREFADRFGFNRRISSDLPVQEGKAAIPGDAWGLAETASGFTRENTMSPLQGALIAASVVNRGIMMEPYIVESIVQPDNTPLYIAEPRVASVTMDPNTASEMRSLMKETVLHGTSRGAFRGFFKKDLSVLEVGGKTGSLTGLDPRGKYDWFVGYADSGSQRIAVAALTIHEKQWRVKSSYLARKAFESYFKEASHRGKTFAER